MMVMGVTDPSSTFRKNGVFDRVVYGCEMTDGLVFAFSKASISALHLDLHTEVWPQGRK